MSLIDRLKLKLILISNKQTKNLSLNAEVCVATMNAITAFTNRSENKRRMSMKFQVMEDKKYLMCIYIYILNFATIRYTVF